MGTHSPTSLPGLDRILNSDAAKDLPRDVLVALREARDVRIALTHAPFAGADHVYTNAPLGEAVTYLAMQAKAVIKNRDDLHQEAKAIHADVAAMRRLFGVS